jgi:hypothetical protein
MSGVGNWAYNPVPEKTNYYESRKKKKTERINTMIRNSKRIKDLRMAICITINELKKYRIVITAIQETRSNPQAFSSYGYNIYTSCTSNNQLIMKFTTINERLCILRVKGRLFNYSLTNIHAPTNDSNDVAKDLFYEEFERANSVCLGKDMKIENNSLRDDWQKQLA